ncbi:MAG: recombination mediator RecR [Patescibacteria group bacterium]
MFPAPIQKLISHFQKLPGIGPRQAVKFALRLTKMSAGELKNMSEDVANLKSVIGECKECFMLFDRPQANSFSLCRFCRQSARDAHKICVVINDHDALAIEKTNTYNGLYHVLGGHVSMLDKDENRSLNLLALKDRIGRKPTGAEVILALNATAEGQATALYLEKFLVDSGAKITRLAQGLSTGSEIEYADDQTLINALKHRR